jgi:DNA topoisomerase-1
MDKANPVANDVQPGISMAFGPVDDNMDVDQPTTNGASANGKRKASMTNGKNYKDASDSESDDVPLVRYWKITQHCVCARKKLTLSTAEASQDFRSLRLRR